MAMACLEVAREQGLQVPRDLSVISFDNTPIVALTNPPLSAVNQPVAETTAQAVEFIIAAKNGAMLPDRPIIVPAGFVERASTAPPAHSGNQ